MRRRWRIHFPSNAWYNTSIMSISDFKNVVWKEDGTYVAQSLNVDVSSFGDSKAEAVANLREALELYFEDTTALPAQTIEEVEVVAV